MNALGPIPSRAFLSLTFALEIGTPHADIAARLGLSETDVAAAAKAYSAIGQKDVVEAHQLLNAPAVLRAEAVLNSPAYKAAISILNALEVRLASTTRVAA